MRLLREPAWLRPMLQYPGRGGNRRAGRHPPGAFQRKAVWYRSSTSVRS